MRLIKTHIVTLLVFFAIDIVWLGFLAKDMYRDNIGHLMADKTNWPAAIIFYMIFIAGLIFFAINPALNKDSWTYALLVGSLFGFMCYSTYDMTNLATLKDWSLKITIIDIIWGTFLNGLTSTISFFIIKYIN